MDSTMQEHRDHVHHFDNPPKYGLKRALDHKHPLKTKQLIKGVATASLAPLAARYMMYYFGRRMNNKKPIMDFVNTISAHRIYGCPIGGIGGGTIGRGFKGEFCRFQLTPGLYEYVTVPECQFIVNIRNNKNETIFQSVLSTYKKPDNVLPSWEWNLDPSKCEYTALYPRAWTTYDLSQYGVKLVCRQVSPIIPHNYKDSSLPCAVFVFSAQNVCDEHRDVSITFTWTEVLGSSNKKKSSGKLDLERYSEDHTCGVSLEQKIGDVPCTFTIAKKKLEDETIHEGYCLWNSAKTSNYVWDCLKKNGKLGPDPTSATKLTEQKASKKKEEKLKTNKNYPCNSIGLSSLISLEPGASGSTEFCLAWDMPIVKYNKDKHVHKRYYTKYFGCDGIAGASLASYALRSYKSWEKQIAEWQDPILSNSGIPDWLKGALMNELYYVADGGTVWFDVHDEYPDTDPRHDFGLFGYLEGHEYRMYNTYDVHFYASFALAQLWPNLQVVIQYMFRETVPMETAKTRPSWHDGKSIKYKVKDSIPHDLGDPEGIPFKLINAYCVHDVSEWKDLNLKFILQVMRDYRLLRGHSAPFTNDRNVEEVEPIGESEPLRAKENVWDARTYLQDMYGTCVLLLRRALKWDLDGDGLIENSGFPDQTFDIWVMTGPSSYCGSMWVVAINMVRTMSRILGYEDDEKEFTALYEKARKAFEEKLWNGEFYRFDINKKNENVVMADQLAGLWYHRSAGLPEEIFPEPNVLSALRNVYENNVMKFRDGKLGAVNGYVKGNPGRVDGTASQSKEIWTGVTYGVASLMIYEGMHEEAFAAAGGLYKTMTDMGLNFETPEALYENGNHRSVGYMRPLAIWSMYQALLSRPPNSSVLNKNAQNSTNNKS